MRRSELPTGVGLVIDAYDEYKKVVDQDVLSQVTPDARLPEAQVYVNTLTRGLIVILPERHDSKDEAVQSHALSVASKILEIPNVKIAVEEPTTINCGAIVSDVGIAKLQEKSANQPLLEFSPDSAGSISHRIFTLQVEKMRVGTSRFAAELMPRQRDNLSKADVNRVMAVLLSFNTSKANDITVYPVGPDHLLIRYDLLTLGKILNSFGFETVSMAKD